MKKGNTEIFFPASLFPVLYFIFLVYPKAVSTTNSSYSAANENSNSIKEDGYWIVEAFPDVVIPGHESVVILNKHYPRLSLRENNTTSNDIEDESNSDNSHQLLSLVATLNIYAKLDEASRSIIYQKTWKINENEQLWWDDGRSFPFYSTKGSSFYQDNHKRDQHEHKRETEVFHVPFRIPSNLSLLKSYPYIENDLSDILCEILLEEETQICGRNGDAGEDDRLQETLTIEVVESTNDSTAHENTNSCKNTKKSLNCESNHQNCTNVSFRLGSSLRQITVFASKLQYKIGETVSLYYAAFDEDGQPYNTEYDIMVTLQDPSKIKVHTWHTGTRGNHINGYNTEGSFYSADHSKSTSFIKNREHSAEFHDTKNTSNQNGSERVSQESSFFGYNEKRRHQNMFQMIEYPLGSKSSLGDWRACAMPLQYFNMEKDETYTLEDKYYEDRHHFCTEFVVTQDTGTSYENPSIKLDKSTIQNTTNKNLTKSELSNKINVKFGRFNKKSYKSGLPYSGKIIVHPADQEIEIRISLVERDHFEDTSIPKEPNKHGFKNKTNDNKNTHELIIDEQILFVQREATFEFSAVQSEAKFLYIKVYLHSEIDHSHQYNNDADNYGNSNSENLQITSNDDINGYGGYVNDFGYFNEENGDDFGHIHDHKGSLKKESDEAKDVKHSETSSILLNSLAIFLDVGSNEQSLRSLKVECQLWTSGFDRSFKSGDLSTVMVFSTCPCDDALNWVVIRDTHSHVQSAKHFISWGSEIGQPYDHRVQEKVIIRNTSDFNHNVTPDYDDMCEYRIGVEMTTRMSPEATFVAWTSESSLFEEASDVRSFEVSIQDRALVILRANATEVSHSLDRIRVEVFAEPNSKVCVYGSTPPLSPILLKEMEHLRRFKTENLDNDFQDLYHHSSNENNVLATILQREKVQYLYIQEMQGVSSRKNDKVDVVSQLDNAIRKDIFEVFSPGTDFWFFYCGNTSDDGYYTINVGTPEAKGEWKIQAASISPMHGIQMAVPQNVVRIKPFQAMLFGIPKVVRSGEIITNVNVTVDNRIGFDLEITTVLTIHEETGSSNENKIHAYFAQNKKQFLRKSGHIKGHTKKDIVNLIGINTGELIGKETSSTKKHRLEPYAIKITAYVTGIAIIDEEYTEVDAIEVVHDIWVVPKNYHELDSTIADVSISKYFCLSNVIPGQSFQEIPIWKTRKEDSKAILLNNKYQINEISKTHIVHYELDNESVDYEPQKEVIIQFSAVSSNKEIVLLLNFPHTNSSSSEDDHQEESFELVIGGGDEHDTTWLSLYNGKKDLKGRVQSANTPNILSHEELRSFWIRIGNTLSKQLGQTSGGSYLEFGQGPSHMPSILSWPVRHIFILHDIAVKQPPGNTLNIRFWQNKSRRGKDSLLNEDGSLSDTNNDISKAAIRNGYSKIFNIVSLSPSESLNEDISAEMSITDGLLLPMTGVLEEFDKRPGNLLTFKDLMNILRDLVTSTKDILRSGSNKNSRKIWKEKHETFNRDNIGGRSYAKGTTYTTTTESLEKKLHQAVQYLLYFRNTDGSFGEPMVEQSVSVAFEQLFLMYEIEKFHTFDPQLTSGLEKWLLLYCKRAFYDKAEITKNTNYIPVDNIIGKPDYHKYHDKWNGSRDAATESKIYGTLRNKKGINTSSQEKLALDILEWSPIESEIFEKYGYTSFKTITEGLEEKFSKHPYIGFANDPSIILITKMNEFSRHIALIFKHHGFERALSDADIGLENDDIFLQCYKSFQQLLKYYSSSTLLKECKTQSLNSVLPTEKDKNVNYRNEQQTMNLKWLQDVVYILSAIRYRKEVNHLEGRYEEDFENKNEETGMHSNDVGRLAFDCILSHGTQLLSKFGYQVVRALDHYHINDIKMQLSERDPRIKTKEEFVETHQTNLKISVATNSNVSWSKTFDLDSSELERKDHPLFPTEQSYEGKTLKYEIPIKKDSTKLYFLATGSGCATLQIQMAKEPLVSREGSYEMNLEVEEDSLDDDILTLFMCVKLKNQSLPTEDSMPFVPTSVRLEFFSGYDVMSITGIYGNQNSFGGWSHEHKYNHLLIRLKKVGPDCGTCFNIKYVRRNVVQNLYPAKISVFSSGSTIDESLEIQPTSMYFHLSSHVKNRHDLNIGNYTQNWWINQDPFSEIMIGAKSSIIATSKLSFICPCDVLCDGNQTKETLKQQNQLNKNQLKSLPGDEVSIQNETSDKIVEKTNGYNSTYDPPSSTENVTTEIPSIKESLTKPFTLKYPIYSSHFPSVEAKQKEKVGSSKNIQVIEENDKNVEKFNRAIGHQLLIGLLTTGKPSNETSILTRNHVETLSTIRIETMRPFVNESKPYTNSSNLNHRISFTNSNVTTSIH